MSLFFFGNNFYKNKETFKIFSPQLLEVYRILLVETTLESITFYYTFSVINAMFVPFASLLYESVPWEVKPEVFKCPVWEMRWRAISWTEHLNTSGITSHATDSFCVKPIIPGHSIPKILTRLTIFWGSIWKTEFLKSIHRQETTSSEEKSDRFHEKC